MKVKKASAVMKAVREFTDREEPRASFWKAYRKAKEQLTSDEPDITVLAYYGIGGIGKSTLLRKLIAELEEQETAPCYVKYDLNDQQECRAVLDRMKNVLSEKYKFHFPLFELGSFVYAKKMGEKADQQEVRQIAEKSPVLSVLLQVTENIPVVGIAAKVLSIADQSVAHIRTHLQNHRPELMRIEAMEPEELYAHLPYLFAQDMTANLEKHNKQPLVIFLDTYEKLVNELCQTGEPLKFDEWLRGEDGLVQNIPHVLWVVAGREKLKWERFDADWSEALEQHILGNLSFADSDNFLRKAGIEDDALRSRLYHLTHGTPVYLDLCVDQYCRFMDKGTVPTAEMFGTNTYDLIERFVRYMTDTQKDMVYMLACLQSWNDGLIEQLGSQIVPSFSVTVYEKTKEYSFVLPRDDGGYSLHQTVGEILRDACPPILRRRAGAALREAYAAAFAAQRVLSDEFSTAMTYTVRAALLEYDDEQALCGYFKEHIKNPLLAFVQAGRFQQAALLLDIFLARAAAESPLRACLLGLVAHTSRMAGEYEKALTVGLEAEALCKRVLGDDHPDTLSAMKYVSDALYKLGRYAQTKDYDERLVTACREVLGEDHPDTLNAMNGLAVVLDALGERKEALRLQQVVYEKRCAVLGEDHPDTLTSLSNLAYAIRETGDYPRAREMQETVLAKRRAILGENHPDTLKITGSLAVTYGIMGEYVKARELKETVLERRREIFGEEHPDTLSSMSSLACTLDDLGEYATARELYETVLERRRELLGDDHPHTLMSMNNLACVLDNMKAYAAARELYEAVLAKRRELLGEDHPDTVTSMNNLACTLDNMKEHAAARELYEAVVQKRREILGEDHPHTLTAMNNLACALDNMKEYAAASELYKTVLAKRSEILGEDYPNTLLAMKNLANTQYRMGDYTSACVLFKILVEKRSRLLGDGHLDTAIARARLADTYDEMGLYEQACETYQTALDAYCRILGEDHPSTLLLMSNLAYSYYNRRDYVKAREIYEAVLAKRRATSGDDHPDTLSAMNNVIASLRGMKAYAASRPLCEELLARQRAVYGEDDPRTKRTMKWLEEASVLLDFEDLFAD